MGTLDVAVRAPVRVCLEEQPVMEGQTTSGATTWGATTWGGGGRRIPRTGIAGDRIREEHAARFAQSGNPGLRARARARAWHGLGSAKRYTARDSQRQPEPGLELGLGFGLAWLREAEGQFPGGNAGGGLVG